MDEKTARRYRKSGTVSPPRGPRSWKRKMCQESFWGLPRGRRVDWRFRCRAIACTQLSSPNGEPRLTLLRTALSSVAVSGLLTRSVQRGERAIGQAKSRRGSRSGSSSHRLSVENCRPSIFSVQGVINPARFVCTFWSSHLGILSELNSPEKSPDTFSLTPFLTLTSGSSKAMMYLHWSTVTVK